MKPLIAERIPNSPWIIIEMINGKMARLLTMNALSKYVGLKSHTLRQWEKRGILPKPLIVKKFKSGLACECDRRFYTIEQADLLKDWVEMVRPNHGLKIKKSMIQLLHEKWNSVVKSFLENYGI